MKKAAILAAALAMVLTLAACGNRDNNNSNDRPNDNNATTDNGNVNGSHDQNGTTTGNGSTNGNGATTGNGTTTGNDPITGSGSLTDNNGVTGQDDRNTTDDNTTSRSRVGNDLRRAADDVGDAVTGMVDGTRNAVTRGTSTTTFQRMLDNARVHDTDGVLSDGENSRW